MATITGTFNELLASVKRVVRRTINLWEKPDGTLINAQSDADGNLLVNVAVGGGGGNVQGVVDDDDPVGGTLPVIIGGVYIDDYEADTLDDGDAGYALLNALRMLIVQSRSYDPVTDADKVVPVVQSFDNNEPFDFSQAVATDALVSHYFSADTFPYWSLILSTATAGATISVKIYASNETTQPNLSLRNHVEITSDLYGGVINLTSAADLALAVDTPLLYDSYCISFDSDIAATWTAQGKKGAI